MQILSFWLWLVGGALGPGKTAGVPSSAAGQLDNADGDGWTALHRAARHGHARLAARAVDARASADVRDADNMTPLHVAAWYGHASVAAMLVDRRADISLRDVAGATPAQLAKELGRRGELLEVLTEEIESPHDTSSSSACGWTDGIDDACTQSPA
mmetsp:Transcript_29758/g.54141  ORF Transcript_29758/g.54141 Transcript_29758/m.54141 type:complete len:156 (+) Transcript_29758:38-505(+)